MKAVLRFLPFLFFLFLLGSALAQETEENKPLHWRDYVEYQNQFGFSFNVFKPTGRFGDILEATPTGFGINYYHRVFPKLLLGGSADVAMYYSTTYDLDLGHTTVEVYEEDCFWQLRLGARYMLIENESFRAFGEFSTGYTNFFSDVSAEEDFSEEANATVSHGNALIMGTGLGMELSLNAFSPDSEVWKQCYLSVQSSYNWATPTSYRSAKIPSGQTQDFDEHTYFSDISYFDFRFGIGWQF